jgi:hypothetical protein
MTTHGCCPYTCACCPGLGVPRKLEVTISNFVNAVDPYGTPYCNNCTALNATFFPELTTWVDDAHPPGDWQVRACWYHVSTGIDLNCDFECEEPGQTPPTTIDLWGKLYCNNLQQLTVDVYLLQNATTEPALEIGYCFAWYRSTWQRSEANDDPCHAAVEFCLDLVDGVEAEPTQQYSAGCWDVWTYKTTYEQDPLNPPTDADLLNCVVKRYDEPLTP